MASSQTRFRLGEQAQLDRRLRAVPLEALEWLLAYGRRQAMASGRCLVYFDADSLNRLAERHGDGAILRLGSVLQAEATINQRGEVLVIQQAPRWAGWQQAA